MACGSCGQKYRRVPTNVNLIRRNTPTVRRNPMPNKPLPDNTTPSTDPSNPVPVGTTTDPTPELLAATGQPASWVANGSGKSFFKPIRKPLTTVDPRQG